MVSCCTMPQQRSTRVLIGFVIGTTIGVVLGLAIGLVPTVSAALQPLVDATFPIA